ncbi:MAG: TIGR04100 family radical SAM protein [Ruminococcus sp.]|nr:TIGR04100 family radical SAM protein [Ruminococcus sp.]
MTILYLVKGNLYVNITNRCPCSCTFCIRNEAPGVYGSDSLWLEHEPSIDEIKSEFDRFDPESYGEIVFCGYGEPTERLDVVCEIGKYVKSKFGKTVRINTNGLCNLINQKPCEPMFEGAVDIVSVSLNAPDKDEYNRITRPKWDNSFEELLLFTKNVKPYVKKVVLTVVDVLKPDEIEQCRAIAEELGVDFRVRKLD